MPPRRRHAPPSHRPAPVVRRGTVRLPGDIAARIRAGHPWVYREVLGGRPLREKSGDIVELVDAAGEFVGRGVYDEEAVIAIRVVTRNPDEPVSPQLVARRVREALAVRRLAVPADLTAYRVINAESDGLPGIMVDRYGDYLVAHLFTPAVMMMREALYDELQAHLAPKAIYE